MIELSILERNLKGEPTGKRLEIKSDSGYEIWRFFSKNQPPVKRKRKSRAASAEEAQKVLNELYTPESNS